MRCDGFFLLLFRAASAGEAAAEFIAQHAETCLFSVRLQRPVHDVQAFIRSLPATVMVSFTIVRRSRSP